MRLLLTICIVCTGFVVNGQDDLSSFYFSEPVNMADEFAEEFDADFLGNYRQWEDTNSYLNITSDTVFSNNPIFMYLTEKEVKRNKAWSHDDTLFFGIIADQGIPFVRSNDTFFLAMDYETPFIFFGEDSKVSQVDDHLMLSFHKEESGYWSLVMMEMTDTALVVSYFDHEPVLDKIKSWKNVKTEEIEGITTYLGLPSRGELEELLKSQKAFEDRKLYSRIDS